MSTEDTDVAAVEAPQHPARPGGPPAPPASSRWIVLAGAVLLLLFAGWRATFGVSLSDDGHIVALAYRLSLGDQPFTDEMNAQSLGSIAAAPFTWLWTQLFGLSGLVLASRGFFIICAALVAAVAYRALRTELRPVTAAVAAVAPLFALPYNLMLVSYNTMPVFGLVVGAAAGFAAVRQAHRGWAILCGAAVAVGVASFPQLLGGGVLLLLAVVLLSRRLRVLVGVVAGAAVIAVPFAVWLLIGPGPELVRQTLDFTLAYQAQRIPTSERLQIAVDAYVTNLGQQRYWPMWLAAAAAAVPVLPVLVRAGAIATVPVLALVPSLQALSDGLPDLEFGKTTAIYAMVVVLALLVPLAVWAVQRRRSDVGVLLALGLPVALVEVPLIGATTSSSSLWGVHAVGAAALLLAVAVGWCELVASLGRVVQPVAAATLVAGLATMFALKPFFDPFPWKLTARIDSGAFAGIATQEATKGVVDTITDQADHVVRPGDGMMFYGVPGSYLLTEGRPTTHIIWLTNYGAANQAAFDYFDRSGRTPDVVFVNRTLVERAGGWDALAAQDPLIAFVLREYSEVPEPRTALAAFRHR